MTRFWIRLVTTLLAALPASLLMEIAGPAKTAGAASSQRSIEVASANLREGARKVRPVDRRAGADRRAAARRLVGRGARLPDVVLLQEVMGTAKVTARTLNRHPRARRLGANYVVAVPTSNRRGTRWCDGRRGPHRVIRDGAILVNKRTVGRVLDRGFVRTWGRWNGGGSYDCAEQAWVRVALRNGVPGQTQARIVNVHAAPIGPQLKSRALKRTVRAAIARNRSTPRAMLVVGGDFNLVRCRIMPRRAEPASCTPRAAHQLLLRTGFVDAVRSKHRHDKLGVVGAKYRLDYIYTQGRVLRSWWDRCYQAYKVPGHRCSRKATVFGKSSTFGSCQVRADQHGRPGGRCGAARYHRYYSDHPVLRATIAWR